MGKKHKKHEEHANHERWLVSYADFITLLFAFFVVMFSSSQVDRSKTKKIALAVEAAFSEFSIFKSGGGQVNLMDDPYQVNDAAQSNSKKIGSAQGQEIFMPSQVQAPEDQLLKSLGGNPALDENTGVSTSEEEALARAQKDLLEMIDRKKLKGAVVVSRDDRGILISIREAGFFDSGAETLTPVSWDILIEIGKVLARLPNQVRVEGHTDNQAFKSSIYPSNWELSSARASAILRWFVENFTLNPQRFSAVGYGEFRPLADNRTQEGRFRNRRVDVVILSEESAKKEAPILSPESGKNEND
jgi:chemotaxis protein MotB